MKNKTKATPFAKQKEELLADLIEKEGVDEMGLLDLVFIEEILNQKKDLVKEI